MSASSKLYYLTITDLPMTHMAHSVTLLLSVSGAKWRQWNSDGSM